MKYRQLLPQELLQISTGDTVIRVLGPLEMGVEMLLKVSQVTQNTIHCGSWIFKITTGGEVDEELGWDGVTKTGSMLCARID